MIVLRESPPSERVHRSNYGLRTVASSLELHGKAHKFCHDIGFMVIARINHHLEPCAVDSSKFVEVKFFRLMRVVDITGPIWHDVEKIVCKACTEVNEHMGGPPLELRFSVDLHGWGDIGLELRDARAVDRSRRCCKVVVILLHKATIRTRHIDAGIRIMLARMIWGTRNDPAWEPPELTRAERMSKSRKAEEEAATKRRHMRGYFDSDDPDAIIDDEDEEEDESNSFSFPDESDDDDDSSDSD